MIQAPQPIETRSVTVSGPNTQALVDKIQPDLEIAEHIEIDSPEMLTEAEDVAGRLAAVAKAIDAERLERGRPLRELQDWLNGGFNAMKIHIETVVDSIRPKILAYHQEQRRKAEEQAEADRKLRAAQVAEAAAAEAAAATAATELMEQAGQAALAGGAVAADELMTQAAQVVDQARQASQAAVVAVRTISGGAPKKAKGVRERWTANVTNMEALILHTAERITAGDTSAIGWLEPNQSALNALAGVGRENFRMPGVEGVRSENVSIRSKAVA